MSQINAPQQQPIAQVAQELQEIQGAQNEQLPLPVDLGSRHGIGQTIGRIFLGVISLGLSEMVYDVFEAHAAQQAARARMPQNQPVQPSQPLQPGDNAEEIRKANAEKADRLKEVLGSVESGKSKAVAIFGTLGPLNNDAYNTALQTAVKECKTEVNDAKMTELADTVARQTLVKSAVKALVDADPSNVALDAEGKQLTASTMMDSDEVKALLMAPNEAALTPLLETVKDAVKESSAFQLNQKEVKQELYNEGMQKLGELTGLAAGSFAITTDRLETVLTSQIQDFSKSAATEARPYAKPDRQTMKQNLQATSNSFFEGRAAAYNAIGTLDISETTKKAWQSKCLTGTEDLQASTFTQAHEIIQKMADSANALDSLLVPDISMDNKMQVLEDFAAKKQTAMTEVIGRDRLEGMAPDVQALTSGMVFKAIFEGKQELLAGLRQAPELVESLRNTMQVRLDRASAQAQGNLGAVQPAVIAADDVMKLLLQEVGPAVQQIAEPQIEVPHVEVPEGEIRREPILG